MDEKNVFTVDNRILLEAVLKRRMGNTVKLNVYEVIDRLLVGHSKKGYAIEFEEDENEQECTVIENQRSKLFVNGKKTIVVYVSAYENECIFKDLDYIHYNYFFAMGTVRAFIPKNDFFGMVFNNDENLAEGNNYGNVENGVLAYDGAYKENECLDMVISKNASIDDVVDAFEGYISTRGGSFEKLLWQRNAKDIFTEFVFVVHHNESSNLETSRRVLGTRLSGKVVELSYGDELRIYVGNSKAEYVMQTHGESILDADRQVIDVKLPGDILVKIYQANAPIRNYETEFRDSFHDALKYL